MYCNIYRNIDISIINKRLFSIAYILLSEACLRCSTEEKIDIIHCFNLSLSCTKYYLNIS